MDITQLEVSETERQLSFYVSHLNQPLTRGEDSLVNAQHDFELSLAREKNLQGWSENLQLETVPRYAYAHRFQLHLPLHQLTLDQRRD